MTAFKLPKGHGKTRIGSVYINLGSDGDQWIISPTKDGGIVITHVPPREPVTNELRTVASVLVASERISAQQITEHFQSSAPTGQEVIAGIKMLLREEAA